ncbi:gas vesicle protein K [Sphaerisporangium melleum]|nr:gas vesicle protein K [Sphaerisporangium melleum]
MQEGPGADQDTKQGRRPSAPHQETKRSRERRGPPEEAEGTSRRAGPYREPGRDRAQAWRLDTDPERVERDLTRLVLTLVELVRQLVERQSVRRMEQGDLTDDQIETLGLTLMRLEEAMTELCERFDLSPADLNLDLGPLGTLLPTDPPDPAAPW